MFTSYEALFYHPGLRKLASTGADVLTRWDYLPTLEAAPRSTQLEELQILNCHIPCFRLHEMLQYPRALKHFTLKGDESIPPRYTYIGLVAKCFRHTTVVRLVRAYVVSSGGHSCTSLVRRPWILPHSF